MSPAEVVLCVFPVGFLVLANPKTFAGKGKSSKIHHTFALFDLLDMFNLC